MAEPGREGRRVLVTGAAGFSWLPPGRAPARGRRCGARPGQSQRLLRRELEASAARCSRRSHERFTFSHLDITDYDGLRALLADFHPEYIVRLPRAGGGAPFAPTPSAGRVSRRTSTASSACSRACRAHPVRHLVLYASCELGLRGQRRGAGRSRSFAHPYVLPARPERGHELMAQTYAHLYGIACSGVRFFHVYGPWGRPDMAYYAFTRDVLEGRTIDVFNHGRMTHYHIDDVTEALVRNCVLTAAAREQRTARRSRRATYNIGNHTPIALERLSTTMETGGGSARPTGATCRCSRATCRRPGRRSSSGCRGRRGLRERLPSRMASPGSSPGIGRITVRRDDRATAGSARPSFDVDYSAFPVEPGHRSLMWAFEKIWCNVEGPWVIAQPRHLASASCQQRSVAWGSVTSMALHSIRIRPGIPGGR